MAKRKPEKRAPVEMWPVPIDDGWDVRMEPQTGRLACGNEQLSVVDPFQRTVRPVALAPARLLRWLTPQTLVWQRSTGPDTAELWRTPVADLAAVERSPVDPSTACGNTFAASNGQWASWLSNGLRLSTGTWTTGAAIHTNVYECQLAGPWLVTARDAGGMVVLWLKQTAEAWIVVSESGALPQYPQCWLSPSGLVGVGYYGLAGVIAPGNTDAVAVNCAPGRPEGIPRLIDVSGIRYVVTASYDLDDQPVLYLRTLEVALDPGRRTQEIAVIPLPFGWIQFDGRESGDGRLELAGNDSTGRLAWVSVDVAALPVGPVAPSPPEPVPIPPDPPEPPAAPDVTMTDYQPHEGPVPLAVRATWAPAASSGPIDYVEWLIKRDGGGAWQVDAHNPSSDLDHTYAIRSPGVWLLALRAEGPGGTHQTGARRAVRATAAVTPIPPEPPMPDMLHTSAFQLASGSLLCADQHQGNTVNATRTEIGAWESFIVEGHPVGGAWVALKSDTGYVCAQQSGHQLSADGAASEALAVRLIEIGTEVALMASDGFYLWAEDGGGGVVLRNGSRIDAYSTFAQVPGIEKEDVVPPKPENVGGKPSREAALKWRSEFLAAPGFEWAFMFPGWDRPKQQAYLDWMRAHGHTHIPVAAWGSYPNSGSPTFDYSGGKWSQFLDLVDWTQAQGAVIAFFCLTDQVWGGSGYTEDWAHNWIKTHVPDLVSRVRMYVNGWEFPQINGSHANWWTWNGDANLRILKTIRQVVGADNYVMCHFTPERLTGWPNYQHAGGGGEPEWWHAAGGNLDGVLWQDDPKKEEALVVSDCIGGPSAGGTTDIGDCNRIVGSPSTWGLNGKCFVAFEFSRDCARGERISRKVLTNKKVSGSGNLGKWNGIY